MRKVEFWLTFVMLTSVTFATASDEITCVDSTSTLLPTNIGSGSFAVVALYATSSNARDPYNPQKPVWFDDIYDYSYDSWSNIPHYLDEVSFGNMEMTADAYPAENNPDSLFMVPDTFSGFGSQAFYNSLLNMADEVIDFSNYDLTGPLGVPDGKVDLLIVNVLGYGAWHGKKSISISGGSYSTDDGVTIPSSNCIFNTIYGVVDNNRVFRETGMSINLHEMGHHVYTPGSNYFPVY